MRLLAKIWACFDWARFHSTYFEGSLILYWTGLWFLYSPRDDWGVPSVWWAALCFVASAIAMVYFAQHIPAHVFRLLDVHGWFRWLFPKCIVGFLVVIVVLCIVVAIIETAHERTILTTGPLLISAYVSLRGAILIRHLGLQEEVLACMPR